MVLHKTLDYGFVGYQVPKIPRATRSVRKRRSFGKAINADPMHAFDLLATVAGNLLLEKESTPVSSDSLVKKEPRGKDTPLIVVNPLEGNLEKVQFVSEIVSQAPITSKDFPHDRNEKHPGFASVITSSDYSEKVDRVLLGSFATKVETCDYVLDDEIKEHVKLEAPKTGDMYSSDMRLESNIKLPLCNEYVTNGYVPGGVRDDVKLVIRDDDENSSRFTKCGTGIKAFRPSQRVGDRRVRKLLASRYWKVTPKSKEATNDRSGPEIKPAYRSRNNCYKRHRSQRDYPFKKRRLYRCSSTSNSDNGHNVVSLPRRDFNSHASNSGAKVNGGSGISACVAGQPTPLQSRDSHVKLRIKSFKVPELFIEIPENATVGNLKKTVLEAVTAVLGGGLRVGVFLQEKKIRDDNRTLLQSGISHDDLLEALGFSLEPNSSQAPLFLQHEDGNSLLSCDTLQELNRYPASPRGVCSVKQPKPIEAFSDPPRLSLGNFLESDHDSALSPPKEKNPMESRTLVVAPALSAEALSAVPLRKSKRSDAAQRRIRRPFSVTEVEALVHAVEKLGTGRWRDVKLRAFDNAKHRTYVDLKDKWKTLVHTARISPQQRRGEPVPQELLDRVLLAHAYWSQHQGKQQLKHQSDTCLLL